MKKKRESVTADEFAAELAQNTEYQAGLSARRERAAITQAEAQPIVAELRAAGFLVDSVAELRQSYSPLPSEAVQVLLKWLPRITANALQDAIVRSLAMVTEAFNVQPLLALFEQTPSESLRWAIANTLAELRPMDARDWIVRTLERTEYGRAREMLLLALARVAPREMANPILLKHLDEMPAHAAIALAESGGPVEAQALTRKAETETGWVRKELQRAVRKIAKRR